MDELTRRLWQRRSELQRRHNLDGTLQEVRRLLERAVSQEREALAAEEGDDARFRELQLDALPPDGPVIERAGLSDGAVAALMERAHGLLMPSRAEGFGLPLTEAAGRGVPILAAPGPAAVEVLGGRATWLSPDDPVAWADAVTAIARHSTERLEPLAIRGWNAHFQQVTGLIARRPGL